MFPIPTILVSHDGSTLRHSPRQQQTIAEPVTVEGFGYWSGLDVRVEFCPAAPHTGIVFVRTDLPQMHRIPAVVTNRVEIPRRTTLAAHDTTVEMVEHVMASLAGLGIDNCEVRVDRAEMPGCDGSSRPFVDALLAAGRVTQTAVRPTLVVSQTLRVGNEECWVEARAHPAGGLSLCYQLDYGPASPIGRQAIELTLTPESFCSELAAARTFILQQEAEWLRRQGLGERVTWSDLLVFDDTGPIGNELRFDNECVRHKMLDLVGDLALGGCDIQGRIVAYRSGHRLNAELVQQLLHQELIAPAGQRVA